MQNYARLGTFGILALIVLRIGIGWHFYMEGVAKVKSGDFSSVGFLKSAQGPLREKFQSMIWDNEGSLRLDQAKMNGLFVQAANRAAAHFDFTEDQNVELNAMVSQFAGLDSEGKEYVGLLNEIFDDHAVEIDKYNESAERVETMKESGTWTGVESLRGQLVSVQAERAKLVEPALDAIDGLWNDYERELNAMASPEQYAAAKYFDFKRPGEGELSASKIDSIIPIFDMVVGILLMVGLLTPLAGWAAALFLLGVVLSQMPGYPGTTPTYFQAIEALACVVVATTDSGRYAGLDFIPWSIWNRGKAAPAA
ncbi:MAG TPA: hypothetical protein DDW52_29615 [Planctomycetaceae bacterium]|nr:hypothetical protein [Planctomycetaceae bacterium]